MGGGWGVVVVAGWRELVKWRSIGRIAAELPQHLFSVLGVDTHLSPLPCAKMKRKENYKRQVTCSNGLL